MIDHLLDQVLTAQDFLGAGADGPLHGEPRELRCRLEYGTELVVDDSGRQVTAVARLYAAAGDTLTPQSLVLIDDVERTVVRLERHRAPGGRLGYTLALLR